MPSLTHAQRLRDRREDQGWVTERGERHEPDPVGKVARASSVTGMATRVLPTPPGPVRVTSANVLMQQESTNSRNLALSSDQWCAWQRKPAEAAGSRHGSPGQAPE